MVKLYINKMPLTRTPIRNLAQCKLCNQPDTNEMVQCDGVCQGWYHLQCVNMTEEEAQETTPWLCDSCTRNGQPPNRTDSTINTVQGPSEVPIVQNLRRTMSVRSIGSLASNVSQREKLERRKQRLQKQKDLLEREKQLMEEEARLQEEEDQLSDNEFFSQLGSEHSPQTKANEHEKPLRKETNVVNRTSNPELATYQIMNRHSFGKDLPIFSGRPEEWAVFISAFEHSTQAMGLTQYENLLRLQRALKGKAREVVEAQLSLPSCVDNIIKTLRTIFGRPELIFNTQIEKIRACPPVRSEKLETIVEFSTMIQNLCATMVASELHSYDYNPLMVNELVEKLPVNLKIEWSKYSEKFDKPGVGAFGDWINELAMYAYKVMPLNIQAENGPKSKPKPNPVTKKTNHMHVHRQEESSKCIVCKENCVKVEKCKQFLKLEPYQRWNITRKFKLCKLCLNHKWGDPCECPKPQLCGKENCKFKHHILLHEERTSNSETESENTKATMNSHSLMKKNILFQYIPVVLSNGDKQITTMAFIDGGSDGTFLEEHIVKQLGLVGPKSTLHINWTDDIQRCEPESMMLNFKISGNGNESKEYQINFVQSIKSLKLPEQTLNYEELAAKHDYLKNLPIQSYTSARPTMLIGLNNWKLGVCLRAKEGSLQEPIAVKSRLGWTICSNINAVNEDNVKNMNFHMIEKPTQKDNDLHQIVKAFFSLESDGIKIPPDSVASKEERRANDIMKATTKLIGKQYETGLLWKNDYEKLPDSRHTALQRLESLENRLNRDDKLKQTMKTQMEAYQEKKYIRKLTESELKQQHKRIWYLPMFPVINPNKPSKIRPVWDAACKTNGVSLNSLLLKGIDQMASLLGVLHRFRQGIFAVTGDIAEMFHRVKIIDEDQHAQRFLWRDCEVNAPPETFVMQVMTFGATCSPSLAQYIKNINAGRFRSNHPEAYEIIVNDHYVDDLLLSVNDEEKAIELAVEVRSIHEEGGFHIRNWKSNSSKIMTTLNDCNVQSSQSINMDMEPEIEKVLGMWWDLSTDTFTYSLRYNKGNEEVLNGTRIPTKREVLRILMSTYDPLGLIGHFTTRLKVLLQDIWRSKTGWDEPISNEQLDEWYRWIRMLPQVEQLRIPRCYFTNLVDSDDVEIQVHIFVDASKNACASVAFLRMSKQDQIECALLGSKTRVAPVKLTSIPRLEVHAAVVGARHGTSIMKSLSINVDKIFYWSDSRTVISWLQADAKRIKGQYVAFRVAEIQDTTNVANWRYVPSKKNVADDATKWSKLAELDVRNRWFNGPEYLWQPEELWPENIVVEVREEDMIAVHQVLEPIIKFERYSDWTKLVRIVAYVFRFYHILQAKMKKVVYPNGLITTEEFQQATMVLYKIAQYESYCEEINELKKVDIPNPTVSKTSRIYNQSPYLDSMGVLRLKGRIDAAEYVRFDTKRPIILDRKHPLTRLIVIQYHEMYLHSNHETVINELRQRYSIGRLRQLLKQVRNGCVKCKIMIAKPEDPEMAPVPSSRVAAYTRPFTYTGVDYFGPMKVAIGRRQEKRWGALFTCLTTRAIHVEIAHSLSTDSFIMCYRNFINRRGQPREIYCDRGTNFVGAEKELKEELTKMDHLKIAESFTSSEMKFVFNPPASPHMGGSWERMVRSVKNTLYAIQPSRTPSDELLKCYLAEVENTVNSRPLTYLPLETEESEAITPNHFLLGSSSGVKPIGQFDDDAKLLKTNWLMTQLYARRFWKRWVTEYLPTLTRRSKWCTPTTPLQVDDIVIIVDKSFPRNLWPKGRIIEVHKAADGQVRSAKVKTVSGIYHRPAVKLAKLDLQSVKL